MSGALGLVGAAQGVRRCAHRVRRHASAVGRRRQSASHVSPKRSRLRRSARTRLSAGSDCGSYAIKSWLSAASWPRRTRVSLRLAGWVLVTGAGVAESDVALLALLALAATQRSGARLRRTGCEAAAAQGPDTAPRHRAIFTRRARCGSPSQCVGSPRLELQSRRAALARCDGLWTGASCLQVPVQFRSCLSAALCARKRTSLHAVQPGRLWL